MADEKRTPLYDAHLRHGARMVPFAGYSMPLQYEGLGAEHARCRTQVALFDVSHMGEFWVRGPDAVAMVNRLISNDLNRISEGQAQYTALCAEDGTIVDDLIVYRVTPESVLLCVNAANRQIDWDHIAAHAEGDAVITDESDDWAQIAVQGPHARTLLARLLGDDVLDLKPFRLFRGEIAGAEVMLGTTGYTGESGGEIYAPSANADAVWRALMEAGEDLGVGPVGLAARDTLRLEMGYCLYGNDIDRTTTPLEAGLGWVTRLKAGPFVGKDALVAQKAAGITRRLVALEITDRGIPRTGYPILVDGTVVGAVTSGTRSPSTGRNIGLGYIAKAFSTADTEIAVDCRGKMRAGRVVALPFYASK